jgi:hypothetical protein
MKTAYAKAYHAFGGSVSVFEWEWHSPCPSSLEPTHVYFHVVASVAVEFWPEQPSPR